MIQKWFILLFAGGKLVCNGEVSERIVYDAFEKPVSNGYGRVC
ncbi:MAG: hypothetical protein ACPL4E_10455 [Thermoproteota archaeon]